MPKPAGVGIRARRPAVRLELMDHRWCWSTKAVLCWAPMCSHPSEGSLHGVDECAGEEGQTPRCGCSAAQLGKRNKVDRGPTPHQGFEVRDT